MGSVLVFPRMSLLPVLTNRVRVYHDLRFDPFFDGCDLKTIELRGFLCFWTRPDL